MEKALKFPTSATVGEAYIRKSKPKILRQIQSDPTNIILDTTLLLKNHDVTLVVDTNYQVHEDFYVCVSSSTVIIYEIEEGRRIGYSYPQDDFLFSTTQKENPERFGWWDIIARFTNSPLYNDKNNCGLVVDSDLKELTKINSREATIWGEHYLPIGFQILYASADSGRESYINKEIKLCDSRAKKTLSQVFSKILYRTRKP